MDDEKPSVIEEGGPDLLTERPHFAGPMAFLVCISFIILSDENVMANTPLSVDLDGILEILSTNNADYDEMKKLQEFAENNLLNLYICIINQNEKKFYYLNATSEEGNKQWRRVYLVYDKHNRSLYPFYTRDNNKKNHTIFSTNATHIQNLFEQSVENYNWPLQPEIAQQTLEQNVSTSNVNFNKKNIDNPSKNIIKASGVCDLFVQNVQEFIPRIGSELDRLGYSFESSEYQLCGNDLMSIKTVCEALIHRLRMLMLVSDMPTDHTTRTNNIHTSMETDETTTVRSPSSDKDEQDVLRNPIRTKLSLRLNAQSMPVTNNDPSPGTTNNPNEPIRLPKLKLNNQPQRFRHNREPKTVGKGCPAVQVEGAPQRTPIQLKLPEEIKNHQGQFYIGTHVTTCDGNEHAQKCITPKPVKKKQKSDEYDFLSKGVFSEINVNDLKKLEKKITVLMCNLKQDDDITKDRIKNDKLIWCRLMFAIYIKLSNGQFERISPPIYTDLIEDTHGSQTLDFDTYFPDKICERGGQIIFIKLDASVEKDDLRVHCNGRKLRQNDYEITKEFFDDNGNRITKKVFDQNGYKVIKTVLSFETPECSQDTTVLKIVIDKNNMKNWKEIDVPYHSHDDHREPCGIINKG